MPGTPDAQRQDLTSIDISGALGGVCSALGMGRRGSGTGGPVQGSVDPNDLLHSRGRYTPEGQEYNSGDYGGNHSAFLDSEIKAGLQTILQQPND